MTSGTVPRYLKGKERMGQLACMRNQALCNLLGSPSSSVGGGAILEFFDSVVFVNDVLWSVGDALHLPNTRQEHGASAICGLDFMWSFYNQWVARSLDLKCFRSLYPFVVRPADAQPPSAITAYGQAVHGVPFRVQPC